MPLNRAMTPRAAPWSASRRGRFWWSGPRASHHLYRRRWWWSRWIGRQRRDCLDAPRPCPGGVEHLASPTPVPLPTAALRWSWPPARHRAPRACWQVHRHRAERRPREGGLRSTGGARRPRRSVSSHLQRRARAEVEHCARGRADSSPLLARPPSPCTTHSPTLSQRAPWCSPRRLVAQPAVLRDRARRARGEPLVSRNADVSSSASAPPPSSPARVVPRGSRGSRARGGGRAGCGLGHADTPDPPYPRGGRRAVSPLGRDPSARRRRAASRWNPC